MDKPSTIEIKNISGSIVTVGDHNLIEASIKFKEIKETEINSDAENWKQIFLELEKLQSEIKNIPEEHEIIRDTELIPEVAKAKAEAKQISENPNIAKKSFIEKIKNICDVSGKVIDVGAKLSPFILTIAKLVGITL